MGTPARPSSRNSGRAGVPIVPRHEPKDGRQRNVTFHCRRDCRSKFAGRITGRLVGEVSEFCPSASHSARHSAQRTESSRQCLGDNSTATRETASRVPCFGRVSCGRVSRNPRRAGRRSRSRHRRMGNRAARVSAGDRLDRTSRDRRSVRRASRGNRQRSGIHGGISNA